VCRLVTVQTGQIVYDPDVSSPSMTPRIVRRKWWLDEMIKEFRWSHGWLGPPSPSTFEASLLILGFKRVACRVEPASRHGFIKIFHDALCAASKHRIDF
jgi:hypothetical protein